MSETSLRSGSQRRLKARWAVSGLVGGRRAGGWCSGWGCSNNSSVIQPTARAPRKVCFYDPTGSNGTG